MQKIIIGVSWGFDTYVDCVVDLLIDVYGHDQEYWTLYTYRNDDSRIAKLRTDPLLQEAVMKKPVDEEGNYIIGKAYGDEIVTAKIVEIPDDVKWHIEDWEMGTGEYVCEDHRVWY